MAKSLVSCFFDSRCRWLSELACLLLLFVYWCCVMLLMWRNRVFIAHRWLAYNRSVVDQFDYLLQVLFYSAYTTESNKLKCTLLSTIF